MRLAFGVQGKRVGGPGGRSVSAGQGKRIGGSALGRIGVASGLLRSCSCSSCRSAFSVRGLTLLYRARRRPRPRRCSQLAGSWSVSRLTIAERRTPNSERPRPAARRTGRP